MTPSISSGETINFTVVHNPLNIRDRVQGTKPWFSDAPIAEYVEGLPEGIVWAVGVNAEVIPPERWLDTYLKPNDFLTIVPVPQGGGGGKGVLRIVGMLALAVAAVYTGGALGAEFGAYIGASAGVGTGLISAGVMMAGARLPFSFLPAEDLP